LVLPDSASAMLISVASPLIAVALL
jgi:hypothetical protein